MNLLEKYKLRYEERCDKKDEFGSMYLKGHIRALEDVAVEIAALIEEANGDLEMLYLASDNNEYKQEAYADHEIYVKALKDLAERTGVNTGANK
jgi:hypothetical protein